MATVASTLTSVSNGSALFVRPRDGFTWSVSGTFVGRWVLEVSDNGLQSWREVATGTAAATGSAFNTLPGNAGVAFRFRCSAYTSGSIVTSMTESDVELPHIVSRDGTTLVGYKKVAASVTTLVRTLQKRLVPASLGHVGATAGFVTRAAADTDLVTVPASQTASTYVIPLTGLKVGDTITAFHLIGELTSGGNAVTVDCSLYKHTAAAGTDAAASLQAMTQISATGATLIDEANSLTQLATPEVVAQDKSYFYLVTVTTGSACTATFQAAATVVTEV